MTAEPNYRSIKLSAFPELPSDEKLSNNTYRAYDLVKGSYSLAVRLLNQDDASALQLRMLAHRLKDDTWPLLAALSDDLDNEEWTEAAALRLGGAIVQLRLAGDQKQGSECASYAVSLPSDG
ncbi:unnamed protein product [Peniophora sp. CBMAI 1063]|nr:unnamed protein product [Peniophora sp. CBMAI 1063]